ncbi:laminin subunit gamma-1 [Hydra vulgaris]|uniref:laminin subunit gamma-1 n=1 Tax=Hydra vulgaris TaxID=6087 RepID=UPI001F5F8D7B|nr:laminin subunit gamma-1 [Hydra vulgaris]
MNFSLLSVFISLNFVSYIFNQDVEPEYGRAIQCKRDDGVSQRCMPVFENIAFDKDIVANNTCGLHKPEQYCVQTGTSGAKKICDYCDDKNPGQRHPANLMTDIKLEENPTWWQSETLLENKKGVHLILDLKKKYHVAFIRIRFHTIRPHSFSIYKKSTYNPNEEWVPYQYYSRTCEETYGVPNKATVSISNQKVALCTDEYSGLIPLSGGNVAFLTLDNRPGKSEFDKYKELQDWVTVTALKINLDQLNTFGDEVFGDPKVLKSYYFAVSDIAVGGRCHCHGHASTCAHLQGKLYCECDHNTAGMDCEKCLPLFNDRPWRAAQDSANPCKACDCNGLADECVFDEQLWIDSSYQSGGRCINCQKNTAGIHCEKCKDNHYRRDGEIACHPCGCNKVGSRTSSCSSEGRCVCHSGVIGDKCDQCKSGYYDFSPKGCSRCDCDVQGSIGVNCDATGQCQCKENVIGKRCNQCAPNHFDLDARNPKGCKACFCYGHGISCEGVKGVGKKIITSSFDSDADGWTLQDELGNDYSKNIQWDSNGRYVLIKSIPNKVLYMVAPKKFLGNRLSSYAKSFSFLYGIFLQNGDPDLQTSDKDIIFEGDGEVAYFSISHQNNNKPAGRFINFEYILLEPEGMPTFDFQKLLSNVTAIKIRVTYLYPRSGAINDIMLESTQYVSPDSDGQVFWQEKCVSKQGHTGDLSENCEIGYNRAEPGSGPFGKCVPCRCNNHTNYCHPETGECKCEDNTSGKNCENCLEGYYGNPTNGHADDCKLCPCIFGSQCILISDHIKCTNCPVGHTGDLCEICDDGYFGIPTKNVKSSRCQKCDCNENVDLNAIGNCDHKTGECKKCIYNTMNGPEKKCELCSVGYYGDALAEPKGNCTACKCFESGTIVSLGFKSGDPIPCDSNGNCQCRKNVLGKQCNTCPSGHWNIEAGCEKCECNQIGSIGNECDIKTGSCKCKPGVTGRKCDQCSTGFYQFSLTGCEACNCHPEGSKNQNCSSTGICDCLPGVLGLKCDKCPENKYNLSLGCTDCPPCFKLIQVVVNQIREKLFNFEGVKNNISAVSELNIRDADFESALNALRKEVDSLYTKVLQLSKDDKALFEFFKSLSEKFMHLNDIIVGLEAMVSKSEGAATTSMTKTKEAEDIIELIKKLLKEIEDKIKNNKDHVNSHSVNTNMQNDTAKILKEIAEEARKLANRQEKESNEVNQIAITAYNISVDALEQAQNAKTVEEKLYNKLVNMDKNFEESMTIANEALSLIYKTKNNSLTVLEDAKDLILEAKKDLPDFMINKTLDKTSVIKNSSNELNENSLSLTNENAVIVSNLQISEKEARDLMEKGVSLRNQSDELHLLAINASQEAANAQAIGAKVAKEAQDMLETLKGFNENIKRSKANASEALKLIPLIEKLIADANITGKIASENADMSIVDTTASLSLSRDAVKSVSQANIDLDDIISQLRALLNEITSFVSNELNTTNKNIHSVDKSLDVYRKQAQSEAAAIEDASSKILFAKLNASKAQSDLSNSLDDVEELVATIENLNFIDMPTLLAAESRLANASAIIKGQIASDINYLEIKLKEQESLITQYNLDLEPLRKASQKTEQLFDFIPRESCYKPESKLEGGDQS